MSEIKSIWTEKWRPKTIDECILPNTLKTMFNDFVKKGIFPNLLLSGGAGTGKTTVARALCNELDFDYMIINASLQRGLDVLRNEISEFASTMSFSGRRKCVILDEADSLPVMTQTAMRNFIEEFSGNCAFILTCNYKKKIIDPLHSRCSVIDFIIPKTEKSTLIADFSKRVFHILEIEQVSFDKKAVMQYIIKKYPDNRSILNELQAYASSGLIDEGILAKYQTSVDILMEHMKKKNYNDVERWVKENFDDANIIFTSVYENLRKNIPVDRLPSAVVILADYQVKAQWAANQEINAMACLVELMSEVF